MVKQIKVNGFTLIEMLFVLSILSILIFITPKINLGTIENIQEEQFLHLLQHDILYIQSLAMTTENFVRIRFYQDRYDVINGKQTEKTRYFPDGWTINYRLSDTIYFNRSGTLHNPRTLVISSNQHEYRLVLPLGKGRGYIVRQ